jgi:hypothetical protein
MTNGFAAARTDATVQREPIQAFRIVFLIAGILVVSATLTLQSVQHPGVLQVSADNPTPHGYTWSLLLFIVPLMVLSWWFVCHSDVRLVRQAFWRTIAVLAPLGCALDLLFGNVFFTFTNYRATLGIGIPAVGGLVPIEEFVFYLSGFMLVLLSYIWADEYWLRAYNIPDYRAQAKDLRRIAQFHGPSLILGVALIAAAVTYKKLFATVTDGWPWYFIYLTTVSLVPSAGFFRTAQPFINWRAFSFTFFLILLISLLWEVTLALPYGWWDYRPTTLIGLPIGAWHGLPIEAVCVWLAVTFTTVIVYEVIKIWQALGRGAWAAFFGMREGPLP